MGLIGGRGLYDANKNSRELASAIFWGQEIAEWLCRIVAPPLAVRIEPVKQAALNFIYSQGPCEKTSLDSSTEMQVMAAFKTFQNLQSSFY